VDFLWLIWSSGKKREVEPPQPPEDRLVQPGSFRTAGGERLENIQQRENENTAVLLVSLDLF